MSIQVYSRERLFSYHVITVGQAHNLETMSKGQLYEDYVCARCEVVCATDGIRKSASKTVQINRMA